MRDAACPDRARLHALKTRFFVGAVAAGLGVAACSTKTADSPAPTETPVAEAKAAASGKDVAAEPPRESASRTADGYKGDAARRIYFRNTKLLYDGAPPPVLKSLVILSIGVDASGAPTKVSVLRSNGFRDLEQRAIRSVHDAAPLPIPHPSVLKRGGVEYVETWLFRDDGLFQIRSLAGAQQSIDP